MSLSKISQTKQNLFTILERGDRKISKIKKRIIALVGLTRVGKSSVYNWILGRQMVGKGSKISSNYVTLMKDQDTAAIKEGTTSVTLIPNCIDIDQETTLIDLAGYLDSRNHVGVLGVSYFLSSVFQKAEEVKFLIVFPENVFFDVHGSGWKKTLLGFINMFRLEALTPEVKDQIFSSISLVSTRSNKPHQLQDYIKCIAEDMDNSELQMQNKEIIHQMMNRIISDHRMISFKMARPNLNPEPCEIFQLMNSMNWEFLKVREIEQQIGQKLINIPFQKDVQSLSQAEHDTLRRVIAQHIESFEEFTLILKELMVTFKLNWFNIRQKQSESPYPQNFMDQLFDLKNVFCKIQQFLQHNDKYKSDELIEQTLRITYSKPTLVEAINIMSKIYSITDNIEYGNRTFLEDMSMYSENFSQLAHCMIPFCINSHQERLILRIVFILKRVFHESAKLYEINPEGIIHINQDIKDRFCSHIYQESRDSYISNFFTDISNEFLINFFKTIPQIEQYEAIYKIYKQSIRYGELNQQQAKEVETRLNGNSIRIQMAKCNLFAKQSDKLGAIGSFIQLLRQLSQQGHLLDSTNINESAQEVCNENFFMKLEAIQNLIQILKTLDKKQYGAAKDLAISLYLACQIYESILLDFPEDRKKRCIILQDYSEHCKKWGRYSEAKILLQKKLQLLFNMKDRVDTVTKISAMIKDQMRLLTQQQQTQLDILMRRFPQNDESLLELLTQIEKLIK